MRIRFRVPETSDPRREGGMQLPAQQSKRVASRWRWILIMALGLSPAMIVGGFLLHGWLWVEAGGFVVLDETRITAAHSGTVRAVYVKNGSEVAAGATLVELDDGALRAELDAVRASIDASARRGAGRSEAALGRQIEAARARMAAQERLERAIGALHAAGAATHGELLDAAARTAATEGELASLEREQAQEAARSRPSPELVGRRAVLEERLRGLRIRAPIGGTVDNLSVSKGENVEPGENLLVLRRGEPRVIGFLPGRDLDLRLGATVRVDLPNGKTIKGRVVGQAPSTLRLPEELSGSFDQRSPRLQMMIAVALPAEARVYRLPVKVRVFRFHF